MTSNDGSLVFDGPGNAVIHGGLTNGTAYYYSVFSYDEVPNFSSSPGQILPTWPNWMTVAAGYTHTLTIKTDGALYAWGTNDVGQLGLGDTTGRSSPTRVGTDTDWESVTAGERFSLAIKKDKSLYAWGLGVNGQLGLNDTNARNVPTRVGVDNNWAKVIGGENHTIGLKDDGSIWLWGSNNRGQLGVSLSIAKKLVPFQQYVCCMSDIAAGNKDSLVRAVAGWIETTGRNDFGQLGLGDWVNREDFTEEVTASSDWTDIVAGNLHSLALKTNGSIHGWGRNSRGQLAKEFGAGEPTPIPVDESAVWIAIATGDDHSLAIKNDTTLWAWGYESFGQLGLGSAVSGNQYSPQQVGSRTDWSMIVARVDHTLGLTEDGCLWAWGDNVWDPTLVSCY